MKRISLTTWILIGLVAGFVFGLTMPSVAVNLGVLGDIFLRLVKSLIAPLMFGTLVASVARAGSVQQMGRIGGKAVIYFTVMVAIALAIGIGAALIVQPGAGVNLGNDIEGVPQATMDVGELLQSPFPESVIDAMARGDVLQVVVFSLLFGFACAAIGERAEPVVRFCEGLSEAMFRYADYIMLAAPIGIFGAMAAAIGARGPELLFSLGLLTLTVYGALAVYVFLVLGPVALWARVPQRRFFDLTREPFMIAFSTTSSDVALPIALENMVKLGVPRHIAALVLPISMSFNTSGSALFLSLASVFVAQAAGVGLSAGTLVLMILTLLLTTKGIGAVPGGSLVILAATLSSFGLPLEGVAILLGIDRLNDMARTSVNMIGHCLSAAVIARWEGVDLNAPSATT